MRRDVQILYRNVMGGWLTLTGWVFLPLAALAGALWDVAPRLACVVGVVDAAVLGTYTVALAGGLWLNREVATLWYFRPLPLGSTFAQWWGEDVDVGLRTLRRWVAPALLLLGLGVFAAGYSLVQATSARLEAERLALGPRPDAPFVGPLAFPGDTQAPAPAWAQNLAAGTDDLAPRRAFAKTFVAEMDRGDVDALESQAAALRGDDATFPNGDSRLLCFYAAASRDGMDPASWDDAHYQARLATLDAWDGRYPDSLTAKLLRCRVLVDFAAAKRARGEASAFAQYCSQAASILSGLDQDAVAQGDPEFYVAGLQVSALGDQPADGRLDLFHRAQSKLPDTWEVGAALLQGLAGAPDGAAKLPAAFGEILSRSPRAALDVLAVDPDTCWRPGIPGAPWTKYGLSADTLWSQVQPGVPLALAAGGAGRVTLGRLAKVAANTGHFSTAALIFRALPDSSSDAYDDVYEREVWGNRETYHAVRKHCLDL